MQPGPREKEYKYCPTCKTPLEWKEIDRRQLLNCPKCNFIFWNNPKPVTSVILTKDDKILLLQRSKEPLKDYWVLPGGYIDYEEDPESAVIRETKEETGQEVTVDRLVGVYQIDNDPSGNNIDIIYCGKIAGDKVLLNDESSQYKFFIPDDLPEKIAYKHREAITDWLKFRK